MARALAIVCSSVLPTSVPSTITGPLKPVRLQFLEERREVDLTRSELNHHLGITRAAHGRAERRIADRALEEVRRVAVLRDHTADVRPDDLELLHRILPGVVDDVAGIEKDAEVRMVDLLDPGEQIQRRVVQPMMVFDDHLDAAFAAERRRVTEHLAPVHPALLVFDAEVQRVLLPEAMSRRDHLTRPGDGIGQRDAFRCRR